MILVFCVALSLVLAQCHSVQVNGQISLEQRNQVVYGDKFMMPLLSRKLKLINKEAIAKTFTDKDLMPEKLVEDSSGEKVVYENEENAKGAADEKSVEDFAMDYHGVRRRRPIHNKQIPFGP